MRLSAQNQVRGRVRGLSIGTIMCDVRVRVGTQEMVATIPRAAAESLGLRRGDNVTLIINSLHIILGKEGAPADIAPEEALAEAGAILSRETPEPALQRAVIMKERRRARKAAKGRPEEK